MERPINDSEYVVDPTSPNPNGSDDSERAVDPTPPTPPEEPHLHLSEEPDTMEELLMEHAQPLVNDYKWWILLFSYATLFLISGSAFFLLEDHNPATDVSPGVEKLLKDEQTSEMMQNIIIAESESYESKKETAMQSFNVILGAFLGFLSASAALVKTGSGRT